MEEGKEKLAKYISADKLSFTREAVEEKAEEKKGEGNTLLNPETGRKYCSGIQEMYLEVLKIFYAQYDEKKAALDGFYADKNWKDYTILIHALKTNALNVGCESFSEECLKLEKAGKKLRDSSEIEENEKYILEHHEEVMDLYSKIIKEVKEYLLGEGCL